MTAKEINALIRDAGKCGLNVYAKTEYYTTTGSATRICKARCKDGEMQVKALSSGCWLAFEGQVYAQ
jgi:hypothetical protein